MEWAKYLLPQLEKMAKTRDDLQQYQIRKAQKVRPALRHIMLEAEEILDEGHGQKQFVHMCQA